jgi:hypothetical protein
MSPTDSRRFLGWAKHIERIPSNNINDATIVSIKSISCADGAQPVVWFGTELVLNSTVDEVTASSVPALETMHEEWNLLPFYAQEFGC